MSLELIIVGRPEDERAVRDTGRRSVRVVTAAEQLYRPAGPGEFVLDGFDMFERIILAYPLDWHALRDDVAVRLGDTRCAWVEFTDDLPGPVEMIQGLGAIDLGNALTTAKPMWTDEVCLMSDVPEGGEEIAYRTGIASLDDRGVRLGRPAFMPVIGPYGSGKSVLLRQLAVSLYRTHGWRTLLTAFEEKIKPRYQRDLRRHMIGVQPEYWTEDEVARADVHINRAFRFLRRARNSRLDLPRLLDRIEFAVKVHGVEVVIIDPVNEIDHEVPKFQSKTDYMGTFIMQLKQLADDYNLLMIVAAHPPKAGVEKRMQAGHLLTINDGADTSHYGNKADFGWAVWRPDFEGPTLLHIDKVKSHEVFGPPSLYQLSMDPRTGAFECIRDGYDIMARDSA
jgi:twinkle protein